MKASTSLTCPICNENRFLVRHEATYVYTYNIDTPMTNDSSSTESALPFLFDKREQTHSKEYIECVNCGKRYPFSFNDEDLNINLTILQKAIRSQHKKDPEFFG